MGGWQAALLIVTRLPWRFLPKNWLVTIMAILRSHTRSESEPQEEI